MCGIAGWLDPHGHSEPPVGTTLAAMAHRGPDSSGTWTDGRCTLGFRRLAVIDLTDAGCQPMADERGEVLVVFNGEIYNFAELRRDLQAFGHHFRSKSDTEVLVHGWRQWGKGLVRRLHGMFAFAVWDTRTHTLHLARDRIGKKPLFYSWIGTTLAFASELQGLLADPLVSRDPDDSAIDEYLSWGYIPAPRTGFVGINKLAPGHTLTLTVAEGRTTAPDIERYWSLEHEPRLAVSEAEAVDLVRHRLKEAVRLRLVSDVPLGVFLSGGIDSSIIVGLMAQLSSEPVRTFSIGFDAESYNELPYARTIARRWGTNHSEEVVRPDAASLLPMLVRHYGEPYADSSAIPTYYVAGMAKRVVTVALAGDGGDEVFGGYLRYRAMRGAQRISRVPAGRLLAGALARGLPDSGDPKSRIRQARRFLAAATRLPSDRYGRWVGYFDIDEKRALYTDQYAEKVGGGTVPLEWMRSLFRGVDTIDPAEASMAVDVLSYLPYDLLVKVDIASMAHSLEVRSPFLDQGVIALAARLQPDLKVRRGTGKWLLKEAFPEMLPGEIARRPKMGFGVPIGQWFRGPLRDLLLDATISDRATRRGRFHSHVVRHLVDEHIEGRADQSAKLWSLVMLEHWHRQFIDGEVHAEL